MNNQRDVARKNGDGAKGENDRETDYIPLALNTSNYYVNHRRDGINGHWCDNEHKHEEKHRCSDGSMFYSYETERKIELGYLNKAGKHSNVYLGERMNEGLLHRFDGRDNWGLNFYNGLRPQLPNNLSAGREKPGERGYNGQFNGEKVEKTNDGVSVEHAYANMGRREWDEKMLRNNNEYHSYNETYFHNMEKHFKDGDGKKRSGTDESNCRASGRKLYSRYSAWREKGAKHMNYYTSNVKRGAWGTSSDNREDNDACVLESNDSTVTHLKESNERYEAYQTVCYNNEHITGTYSQQFAQNRKCYVSEDSLENDICQKKTFSPPRLCQDRSNRQFGNKCDHQGLSVHADDYGVADKHVKKFDKQHKNGSDEFTDSTMHHSLNKNCYGAKQCNEKKGGDSEQYAADVHASTVPDGEKKHYEHVVTGEDGKQSHNWENEAVYVSNNGTKTEKHDDAKKMDTAAHEMVIKEENEVVRDDFAMRSCSKQQEESKHSAQNYTAELRTTGRDMEKCCNLTKYSLFEAEDRMITPEDDRQTSRCDITDSVAQEVTDKDQSCDSDGDMPYNRRRVVSNEEQNVVAGSQPDPKILDEYKQNHKGDQKRIKAEKTGVEKGPAHQNEKKRQGLIKNAVNDKMASATGLLECDYTYYFINTSRIHGNGLFASKLIPKDSMIIEYQGVQIGNMMADKLEEEYQRNNIDSIYLFRLDKDLIIDATVYGNKARFINHCCDPNAEARVTIHDDRLKLLIYALKDIRVNQEITMYYNFSSEAGDEELKCSCGSDKCRKVM